MGPIILLILLGLILLLVETLLLPGFAFTGILGLLSLAAACYFGFVNFGNLGGIITIIFCVLISAAFMIWILRSKTWKKATLETKIGSAVDQRPKDKGISVGLKGVTTTRLNPMGRVRFENGEEAEVHSLDGLIEARRDVKVADIEEEKIFVKLFSND
ncbi:MAG: NfeD family protein [Bacteroidales bacterium]|nr:NfeD family protein [Bacteroidales bacterium]